MIISGNHVRLRAIEIADVPSIHRWTNDPEIQAQLGGWHFPLSMASLESWVTSFRHDSPDQRLLIDSDEAGTIGVITLTAINWKDRNAFEGLLIGEREHRRKGYARDALSALMRYAFEEMGLERLDTTIIEYNEGSLALHEQLGWITEGIKERAIFRRNRFWSNVVLGITRRRYETHGGASAGKT